MLARFFHTIKNPYIALPLLWLLAAIIVNPIGEFPLNDDWSYSKNVYNLSVNNQFVVDPWPAMNLFSQTIYGTLVCKLFGFSFTALRLSILLLAIISSILLYKTVLRISNNQKHVSLLVVTGFCFSTLLCSLSFTFMTDIFFLSFMIFAIYQIQLYAEKKSLLHYLLFILFCVIAVLNRQHGVLIPGLIIGAIFYNEKISVKSIIMMALPIVLTWLAHDKYRHYLTWYGIPHNLQNTDKLWKYLDNAPFEEIHAHAGDLFLTTGWLMIPLILLLILTRFPKPSAGNIVLLGACAIVAALIVWEDWHLYPQGNVSRCFEIGPRVLKIAPEMHPDFTHWWWPKLSRVIAYCSGTLCLFFIALKFISKETKREFKITHFTFLVVAGIYFVFVSLNEAYLDRYTLPLATLVLLLLIPQATIQLNSTKKGLLYSIIFITFITSTLETRDYFNWQKTRWNAADYLHKKNITPAQIDGGFEYNGWYANTPVFSEAPKSWWWVQDDAYIIARSPLKNYSIDTIFINPRWIPLSNDSVYLLKRIQ